MNTYFPKEDIRVASKYMKRCPMAFVIREMQINWNHSELLLPTGKTTYKKVITSADKNVEKLDPSYTAGEM